MSGSEPNPVWYYMEVDQGGTFDIDLVQTTGPNGTGSGIDVDFALYGPFSSLSTGCNSITNGSSAPIQCSYSTDYIEQIGIGVSGGNPSTTPPAAVAGQVYIVLITNYSGTAGYIDFNQTGGSGVADCSIVTPCDITGLTATPGACVPATNTYTLTGQITFVSPPGSGTLTISSSCGGSQVFNAPFTSPLNYSIASLPSNGAACTVTASFSGDATCTLTQNYTAPPSCVSCNMTGITTNVGACNPATNQYAVSGQITFTNPPASGTLTISSTCGGTQTYNAPFSSPAAYNFTGLPSNGGPCTVNASFSANPACAISQNYTAPPSCLPPCYISYLFADIGTCQGDNTFPVTGNFTYENNPGSGTVVVTITNSSGTYTQTFNPPFVNGQSYNYTITNCISDGSPLTVTVAFSADPACTSSVNSTSPESCLCAAEIGTFTAAITGVSTNNYVLCYGDEIDITANGDYTPPGEATDPPFGGGYEPGITWLVYTCPPTVALTPSTTEDIPDDPCLLGMYSDFDMYDINDQYWIDAYPPGTFTNNTVYFVPITMYNLTFGYYSYVNTELPCYELGTPFAIQYLPEITFTQTQSCTAGTVTATVSGGLPAVNGSQFTGVAGSITPANASFVNTTASNGGTISIGGLTAGQAYSFQIQDANGCPITVTGTFIGLQQATLTYPQTAYCQNAANPSPTITGMGGGTYTSTAGLSINASTGVINLGASTAGTYTITYTTPGPTCQGTSTFTLTINPLPTIVANNVTVCVGGTIAVSASGASTYTWSPGTYLSATTGSSVNFTSGVTTNYTVSGTDGNGCVNTDPVTVTVNGNAPINAGPDASICAGGSSTLTASGGTSYDWTGIGVGNGFTVSPAITTTYTVNGTDINGCLGSDQVTITVNPNPTPVITGPSTYCSGNPAVLSTTLAYSSYSWSTGSINPTTSATDVDNPITVQVTNAQGCIGTSAAFNVSENPAVNFNSSITICQGQSAMIHGVSQNAAGTYSQTFVMATGCDSISNVTLIVNPLPNVNAGPDQSLCFGNQVTLTANGANTYSWSPFINNGVPFNPPAGTTTYTVIGTDNNGCMNSDQVNVTLNPLPNVSAGPDQSECDGIPITLTPSGANTYTWTGSVSSGVPFNPPVGTNSYTVTGTDVNGCVNTDQVVVVINPIPTVFAGNDVVICDGGTVTLTASGASTYTWSGTVQNGIAFEPTVGQTTYDVTGTTAAGCENTDQVMVTVNPNPVVTFTPDVTLGCAPLTVNFINTTADISNCIWTFSNGTVLTGCGPVPVTFTQGGCYDVNLTTTSTDGCTSTMTSNDLICVEEAPDASFIPSSNQVSTLNTEVQFDNTTTGASSYMWNFGDESTQTDVENPTHVYPDDEAGMYVVTLIAYSPLGCPDTAVTTIQIYEELIFYVPNTFTPDDDRYNPVFQPVFTSGFDPQDYVLFIYDRWGELIFESHNAEVGWNGSYGSNREVELCQDGVYTWKIEFKVTRHDERKMAIGHVNLIR